MNKKVLGGVIGAIVVVLIVVGAIFMFKSDDNQDDQKVNNNTDLAIKIENVDDLQKLVNEVHENSATELPSLDTMEIELEDEYQFSRFTGLQSNENVEAVVVAMPLINAQAYEAAAIKLKDGADVEKLKQEILDNINMDMWVCVSAEKLYVTNYGNVIFLVMGQESEWYDSVFNSFKAYVGEENMGKTLEKVQDFEDFELPPEILLDPAVDGIYDEGLVEPDMDEQVPVEDMGAVVVE